MDDFTKQHINEERLKQLRNKPVEEYIGDYNSPHYKEVPNSTIKPTPVIEKDIYKTEYKKDFDKASRDYWQKETQTGLMKYNGGCLTANFGKDDYTVKELLERVGKFIKEAITTELLEKKLQPEDLAENFKAVEVALSLLADAVSKMDEDMDIKNVSAYMHGFINTYIGTIINKKIERDKGATNAKG